MAAEVDQVAVQARRQFVRAALRRAARWRPILFARVARCESCGERIGPYAPRWSVSVAGLMNAAVRFVLICNNCAGTIPFERRRRGRAA